jgi:uncharacterized protein (TIGR00251 family)
MADEVFIAVRVTPRSARDEVAGWREGKLMVRLRVAPIENQANEALRRLLAKRLGLTLRDIEIVRGQTARTKRLRISGLDEIELRRRLA